MAFNPFDVFRRNQRILFSAITVVIMFVFILQFGQGDLFQSIPRWVAASRRTGNVVAVVDGSKLYQSQLAQTDDRRTLANQHMSAAGRQALQSLVRSAGQAQPKMTASNAAAVKAALDALQRQPPFSPFMSDRMVQRLGSYMQFGDLIGPFPSEFEMALDRAQTAANVRNQLAGVAARATDENDLAAVRDARRAVELFERLAAAAQAQGRRDRAHYFGNQPAATNRDAVDFTLWLRKADDLGVHFTDDDVEDLRAKEFYGAIEKKDWDKLEEGAAARAGRAGRGELLSALGDEFRVRAAQGAVLGQAYLKPGAELYEAPADYFKFFRDETAPARFGAVTVPAANYLSKVTAAPTDRQLKDLFDKAKSDDADPALARVGLREPRRLKIASVEVTGEEPYYAAASAEGAKALTAAGRVGGFLFAPPGPGLLSLVAAAPAATSPNLALDRAYADYVAQHKLDTGGQWYATTPGKVIDSHLATPATTAALVGSLAGHPLAAAVTATEGAFAADRRARLDTVAPSFAVPLAAAGSNLGVLVAVAAPQVNATRPLPRAAVEPALADKFRTNLTRSIAVRDVNKFRADLVKLNAKSDDPAARKLVADFAGPRGLTVRESAEFRDRFALAQDPNLFSLALKAGQPGMFRPAQKTAAQKAEDFGRLFFFESDPLNPNGRPQQSTGFFKPLQVPPPPALFGERDVNVPATLAWRTAEQPTEPLRGGINVPENRAKAVAAWRRLEARKLARQAADDLAKQCTGLGQDLAVISQRFNEKAAQFRATFPDPADQARVRTFDLENVAPLPTTRLVNQSVTEPFALAPSDDIPYPTAAMRQALLDARTKPPSTAVVLTDTPEDVNYVAVLLARTPTGPDLFALSTYSNNSMDAAAVNKAHQEALRKQARDAAAALLRAEYGVANESADADKKADAE